MKKEKPVPLHEMSLRDFFAAFAMMGAMANNNETNLSYSALKDAIVMFAYNTADAMMKEREK